MKVLATTLVFASVLGATFGAPQGYTYETPAAPVSYSFGYDVNAIDAYQRPVTFGHSEGREGPSATGSYYVLLPDGRLMTVSYVADQYGFHPTYTFQQLHQGGQAALATPSQLYGTPAGK
ncbi:pro-resilin-like [Macrobrachium rosenbergii]|uniref:pro-resilin-like n=1 Tax=Macrobrachium rosenbergii TaxID=79674 RepID=UPI0034D655FA